MARKSTKNNVEQIKTNNPEQAKEATEKKPRSRGKSKKDETAEQPAAEAHEAEAENEEQITARAVPRHIEITEKKRGQRSQSRLSKEQAEKRRALREKAQDAKIAIPSALACAAVGHGEALVPSADEDENTAFSLNYRLVEKISRYEFKKPSEDQQALISFVKTGLEPLFRFGKPSIPAYCKSVIDELGPMLEVLQSTLPSWMDVTKEKAYGPFLDMFIAWTKGKAMFQVNSGDAEAWEFFDKTLGKYHPSLVGIRTVAEFAAGIDLVKGWDKDCQRELCAYLLERDNAMRYSGPGKLVRNLLNEASRIVTEQEAKESIAARAKEQEKQKAAAAKSAKHIGLLKGLVIDDKARKEEEVADEARQAITEKQKRWCDLAQAGKLHSGAGLFSIPQLLDYFEGESGEALAVMSFNPSCPDPPLTMKDEKADSRGRMHYRLKAVALPSPAVETEFDREGNEIAVLDGRGKPKPRYNHQGVQPIEKRYAILMDYEAMWMAEARFQILPPEKVKAYNEAKTEQWAAYAALDEAKKSGISRDIEMAQDRVNKAGKRIGAFSDDTRKWREGKLDEGLGVLRVYDLITTLEHLRKPKPKRDQRRDNIDADTEQEDEQESDEDAVATKSRLEKEHKGFRNETLGRKLKANGR